MRKCIHKLFWVWDFDKEEKWLNVMVAKGLCLISVGFCKYEFEDCRPGEYSVRMERLEHHTNHPESVSYMSFLEETGAEHIGSYNKWVYLRKKRADGEFQLFSDYASRITQLTRILQVIGAVSAINLLLGGYNLLLFFLWHAEVNLLGSANLALGLLGWVGFIRLYRKRKRLKSEQQIYE